MRRFVGLLAVLTVASFSSGCATSQGVRYVYQDGDFGVVGMPENSDRWPTHYRRRAEKLMDTHFPEGHEIVRAEEVVEGQRTLKLEGSNTAEVSPQLPAALLNVAKVGHSESHSQADTLKLKECRIVYRRTGAPDRSKGYAAAAGLNPTRYIDPNDAERRKTEKSSDWDGGHDGRSDRDDGRPG
jgi:hypothetical protein